MKIKNLVLATNGLLNIPVLAAGKPNNLLEEFGLTVEAVVKTSKSLIKNEQKELL